MTIDSKILEFFSEVSIKLPTKPAKHLKHQYADYIEVISLFSNNNFLSSSDVIDRFEDEGIIRKNEDGGDEDQDRAENNDRDEVFVNELFAILSDRESYFSDIYPFCIYENNKIKLRDSITPKHKLYLFLLISSNLNIFHIFQPELTTDFEEVSFHTLKNFLPSHAQVKSFGKNSLYTGTAREKIHQLASELSVEVDRLTLNQISSTGVQERGLDLVGWIPFSDNIPNSLSIFCQCACGKEWYKKLMESRRYENYYRFHRNKPVHAFFIPYALLDYQNSCFYQSDEITSDTLLFERKRILNFIKDDIFFESCNSNKIVNKCISTEESIV